MITVITLFYIAFKRASPITISKCIQKLLLGEVQKWSLIYKTFVLFRRQLHMLEESFIVNSDCVIVSIELIPTVKYGILTE